MGEAKQKRERLAAAVAAGALPEAQPVYVDVEGVPPGVVDIADPLAVAARIRDLEAEVLRWKTTAKMVMVQAACARIVITPSDLERVRGGAIRLLQGGAEAMIPAERVQAVTLPPAEVAGVVVLQLGQDPEKAREEARGAQSRLLLPGKDF